MGASKEYYLSKGFEPKMAEYFANGRKQLKNVEALDNYRILLTYEDGDRILDLKETISTGSVFEFLLEPENFSQVYVDENHNVCWNRNTDSKCQLNNKIDISSDTCYVDSVRVE